MTDVNWYIQTDSHTQLSALLRIKNEILMAFFQQFTFWILKVSISRHRLKKKTSYFVVCTIQKRWCWFWVLTWNFNLIWRNIAWCIFCQIWTTVLFCCPLLTSSLLIYSIIVRSTMALKSLNSLINNGIKNHFPLDRTLTGGHYDDKSVKMASSGF